MNTAGCLHQPIVLLVGDVLLPVLRNVKNTILGGDGGHMEDGHGAPATHIQDAHHAVVVAVVAVVEGVVVVVCPLEYERRELHNT